MAVVAVRLGVAGGGELDDSGAPVTQWIEDAAMHRAQAVRTGDDDWEMKLGDGARAKRREAGAGDGGDGGVSPRFQMNSMESIMSHAKQVSSGPTRSPSRLKDASPASRLGRPTSPAASSLIDPPSRAPTINDGHLSARTNYTSVTEVMREAESRAEALVGTAGDVPPAAAGVGGSHARPRPRSFRSSGGGGDGGGTPTSFRIDVAPTHELHAPDLRAAKLKQERRESEERAVRSWACLCCPQAPPVWRAITP
jgi:hypothetical protein